MALLERSSSLEYADILVRTHVERAQEALDRFPDSEAKTLMLSITDLVMSRHD